MKYFKITKELDQLRLENNLFLVVDELITIKEAKRRNIYNLLVSKLEPVEINKNKTYFFFGVRRESKQ